MAGRLRLAGSELWVRARSAKPGVVALPKATPCWRSRLQTQPAMCPAKSAATRLTPNACTFTWCGFTARHSAPRAFSLRLLRLVLARLGGLCVLSAQFVAQHMMATHLVENALAIPAKHCLNTNKVLASVDPRPDVNAMTKLVTSFGDLSLKVVAVRTADDSDFQFKFPASGPPTTPSALTTPLEQPMRRLQDPSPETDGWQHGGLNE